MKRQPFLKRSRGGAVDDANEKDDTKRRSRNLGEKKRRDQFNILIDELSSLVTTTTRKMDKSTVLKSAIAFLKNHNVITEITTRHTECSDENWKPSFLCYEEFTHLMLEALDAFILVFSITTGKIIYMSENVTSLLGYPTNEFNKSIFELINDDDKSDLYDLLHRENVSRERTLSLHMNHGPVHTPDIRGFESIRLIGSFYNWNLPELGDYDGNNGSIGDFSGDFHVYFVSLARLCTPQPLLEMTLSDGVNKEFVSKHSLEWKFLFLDHRASPIIGYLPFEVLGTSGYDYYHVDDLEKVSASHEMLMQTGEGTSCFYRFLTKGQQWIWLQTHYYISYHQWNSKPEFVVCTHTVCSYDEVQSSTLKKEQQRACTDEASEIPERRESVTSLSAVCTSPSVISRAGVSSSRHSDISSVSSTVHLPQTDFSSLMQDTSAEIVSEMQPAVTESSPPVTVTIPEGNPVASMEERIQMPNYQYLQWRRQQLQQQITMQQEELRHVSQKLLSVQVASAIANEEMHTDGQGNCLDTPDISPT